MQYNPSILQHPEMGSFSICNRLFRLHHCQLYYCYGLGLVARVRGRVRGRARARARYSTITKVHIDNDVI